ncbi:MAG: hypothetical protein EZS28_026091 [Streblomastix strix]|uniref:Uncharacterized protein n=1 Tax=Streblomastix strix TaxID=222440 RepID=A0A5J4V7E1_9EUKA|nr:MAG: hypothetical protein EZS28_026091 [Streblomastix strix]
MLRFSDMTFNKLLLILALAILSNAYILDFPKYRLEGTQLIWDYSGSDQGVVTVDTSKLTSPWNGKTTDESFTVLPERIKITSNLVFDARPNFASYEDICDFRYYYYASSIYDFWGTIGLAYYNISVIPSDLHFLNCHPRSYKEIGPSGQVGDIDQLEPVCDQDVSLYPVLRGMVDTSCYGTAEKAGDACKATCTDGSALKAFGTYLLYGAYDDSFNENDLKLALVNFGPVLGRKANNEYFEVFYGWKTTESKIYYLSFVRGNDGHISFTSDHSSPFQNIEEAYIVYGTRQDLSAQDPHLNASGVVRAVLSLIAAVLVLPALLI